MSVNQPVISNRQPRDARPNIIVILTDDMGFSDIGCFGSEIHTPNLDALAASGVRLTQMYNCARCCPTRASLLTGLHPHQAGIGHMVGDHHLPGYRGFLRRDTVTIAETLRASGYQTCMSGKWHVGGHYDHHKPDQWKCAGSLGHPTPRQRGFDHFYGIVSGCANYFNPATLMRDDIFVEPEGDKYYFTDAISDQAAAMIHAAAVKPDPFFMYVAYTAPHWPLQAPAETIGRYEGQYRAGWDAVRCHRHETLKASGLLDPRWPISLRDAKVPAWADAAHHDWEDLRMATYAAQVQIVDEGVRRILAALRQHDMLENTLILFLADNGGCAEFLNEDGNLNRWPGCYALPTRDGRGRVRVGNIPGLRPGPEDVFMSYDTPWANVSNSPFRLYKHYVHEGGIATPFIAHWPARIARPSIAHAPCHVVDVMATCLDAAGAAYPAEHAGTAVQPMEGESLLPVFQDASWRRQRPIFWEHEGNRAVRAGEWKLVCRHPGRWELYNIADDRTESTDLAAANAPMVEKLAQEYARWATTHDVRGWPPENPT